ncbi:MAG: hypothetical protein WDN25_03175 [Acetobacteraceae bacterium]
MATAAPAPLPPKPSPTLRLVSLVRALIDYGRQLAAMLQQRTPATDLTPVKRNFGTVDIALILACITRGLHRAAALEARLDARLAREQAASSNPTPGTPAPGTVPRRQRRAAKPLDRIAGAADPRLVSMPTPRDIAAEIRRRPIGAVIADICRDLGIMPSHALWRELSGAIIASGGNLATLVKDICDRATVWLIDPPASLPPAGPAPRPPAPRSPGPLAPATGPP